MTQVYSESKAPVSQLVNADDTSVIEIKTLHYLESILGDPGAVSRGRAKWRDESFQERAEEPLGLRGCLES